MPCTVEKTVRPCGTDTYLHAIRKDGKCVASWYSGPAVPRGHELFWTNIQDFELVQASVMDEETLELFLQ